MKKFVVAAVSVLTMAWGNAQKTAAYFNNSFQTMFKGKDVELMDRNKTNQVGQIYMEDNRLQDINEDSWHN